MKITIVLTNLETSGTFKMMCAIGHGFEQLGWEVQILYSGESADQHLVRPLLGTIPTHPYAGRITHVLSKFLQLPVLRLFASGLFSPSQSINFIGQFSGARRFLKLTAGSDLILYSNVWAIPPWQVLRRVQSRSAVLFHEALDAEFLPGPLRHVLNRVILKLVRGIDLPVSITFPIGEACARRGLRTVVIYDAFRHELAAGSKEDFVLADSRWIQPQQARTSDSEFSILHRDPLFLVRLASQLPSVRFVLCGRILDPSLLALLMAKIDRHKMGFRVEVKPRLPEGKLQQLYQHAKCVVRWGTERGFPWSLVEAVSAGCIPIFSKEVGGSYHLAKEVSPDLVVDTEDAFVGIITRLFTDHAYYLEIRRRVDAWRNRRPWTQWCIELLDAMEATGMGYLRAGYHESLGSGSSSHRR